MRNIIAANPEIEFYYFSGVAEKGPPNAHAIAVSDHHRTMDGGIDASSICVPNAEYSLEGKAGDIGILLDMAAAVADTRRHFDIVDIPDYEPFYGLLPELLRLYGVTFDRAVQSLHGALTLSIGDLWQGPNTGNLSVLRAYERLAYRAADVRYGISQAYIRQLTAQEDLTGVVIDPFLAVNQADISWGEEYSAPPPTSSRRGRLPRGLRPQLNFVGRQDKIKGPDLFLYFVANLPLDRVGEINLYGHSVEIEGTRSATVLTQIAEQRGIKIHDNRPLPHRELLDIYATRRDITFITSRVDTFNLAAFESLLNGCPTVISKACGICDYLDEVWPDLPYVKFDPDNIWESLPAVVDVIDQYDEYRQRIAESLSSGPRPYGGDLASVLNAPATADGEARRKLAAIAAEIVQTVDRKNRPRSLASRITEAKEAARAHAIGHNTTDLSAHMPNVMRGVDGMNALCRQGARAFAGLSEVDSTIRELTQIVEQYRAERIGAFDLLARAEQVRGNDLLYAVYQARRFRLARRAEPKILESVRRILIDRGFPAEEKALQLMYRGAEEDVYEHLYSQRALCGPPGDDGIDFVEHFNRRENPRVAVLVSVYNAAEKLPQFVQGMRSFVPETLKGLEVIFVDSGSPDDSSAVLRRELSKPMATDRALDATIMRTTRRETIQAAWNRALTIVRAPYITFLGADEMMRPDSLEILAGILDREPGVDWVQGNAVVCEVNEHGTPVRDVMTYNRMLDRRFMHYLDCCYMGWVGGLYRRRVHDVAGYYNPTFRAAGDNEFKNRALPVMSVKTIPDVLGMFRNFPEERTTQSPLAEVEDLRAWYLPRSVGGMRYAFEGRDPCEAVELFFRCLSYRKTYMNIMCTDLDLALSVARFLELYHPDQFVNIQRHVPSVIRAANAYRELDGLISSPGGSPITTFAKARERADVIALEIARSEWELREGAPGIVLGLTNDNRHHQHHNVWKSVPNRYLVGRMLDFHDLAGPQDLAEVLSSCQSSDPLVDFETAWTTNQTEEVRRLFEETSLDLVLPVPDDDAAAAAAAAATVDALRRSKAHGKGLSLVVAGAAPRDPAWGGARIYVLGRARTLRPVLAAGRLPILPYWSPAAVTAMLPTAVDLLCSGKPMLVSRPMAARLATVAGDLSEAEADGSLIVCETIDDLAAQAAIYVRAPHQRRLAATKNARAHAARLRDASRGDGPIEATSAATTLPLGDDWLIEWDEETEAINRALHSLIELDAEAWPRRARLDTILSSTTARAKLAAIADALLVRKDAHALETSQSFFQILRRQPMATSVVAAVAQMYLKAPPPLTASQPERITKWKNADCDIAIPGTDAAWFHAALETFIRETHLPYLAGQGVRIVVLGVEPPPQAVDGVTILPPGCDEADHLQAARAILCLGDGQASLRPGSLDRFLPMLSYGKPLMGTPEALWFVEGRAAGLLVPTSAKALADDILDLLADESAAAVRAQVADAVRARLTEAAATKVELLAPVIAFDVMEETESAPEAENDEKMLAEAYWRRYPDVAADPEFGMSGTLGYAGAFEHYRRYGQQEERVWTP